MFVNISPAGREPDGEVEQTRNNIRTDLEASQWKPAHDIAQVQRERLQKLLTHAYQNVPFYRRRMNAAGLRPDEIRTPEDFQRLPILSKADVQENLHDLAARNIARASLICDSTGGSTGEPLCFYRDDVASLWIEEACARFRNWIGYTHGDKLALIWGALRDVPSTPPPHERWLNSFDYASEGIERFIRELVEWQPRAIRAYPSAAAMVSNFVRNARIPAPRPSAVECSAEKMWPEHRRLIEEVFDCPVFDMYGSREVPALACECEFHSGLHVFSDIRLVEVVRNGLPARPSEEGAIVVTDLLNYGMPLIRYEIGDVGAWAEGPCACGRAFPRLREITGRVNKDDHDTGRAVRPRSGTSRGCSFMRPVSRHSRSVNLLSNGSKWPCSPVRPSILGALNLSLIKSAPTSGRACTPRGRP